MCLAENHNFLKRINKVCFYVDRTLSNITCNPCHYIFTNPVDKATDDVAVVKSGMCLELDACKKVKFKMFRSEVNRTHFLTRLMDLTQTVKTRLKNSTTVRLLM